MKFLTVIIFTGSLAGAPVILPVPVNLLCVVSQTVFWTVPLNSTFCSDMAAPHFRH